MKYIPTPIDTSHIQLSDDVSTVIELIAKNNHENWAKQRISEGWKYGRNRDDANKEHPDLIPYEELSDSEKEFDRKTTTEILKVLINFGFIIFKQGH